MILPLLGAIFLLLIGGGSIWVYDRHDPIGFHATVLWWHPGFDAPDSLLTQKEKADARAKQAEDALVPWKKGYADISSTLRTVQHAQQAVIDAGKVQLKLSDADAQWSLGKIAAGEAMRNSVASSLPSDATGDSACKRAEAVDAAFVSALRNSR